MPVVFAMTLLLCSWISASSHADPWDEELKHEVIELEVDAVAVSDDPLEWELLPPVQERVHGNALEHYRRAWQWTEIIPLTDWGTLYEMPMAELVERQSRADGF
ncbi:MAG: hypothetical protein AAGA57_09035, partial [Planctomycetota bacterium]